jgi:hypothetical protein
LYFLLLCISYRPRCGCRPVNGSNGSGCRTLAGFKGAGFDFLFPSLLTVPVTLSPQNRSSTIEYCCLVVNNARQCLMIARGILSFYPAPLPASCTISANPNYSRTYASPRGRGYTGPLVRPLPQLFCFPYLRKNGGIHARQKCRRAEIRSLTAPNPDSRRTSASGSPRLSLRNLFSAFRLSALCVSAVSPSSLYSPLACPP